MSDKPELTEVAGLIARQLGFKDPKFCGKGSFKETYQAEDRTGHVVALKLVDRTKINVERTDREIEALKRCNSLRVAKVLATTTFSAPDKRVFDVVVEEFFDGGSLEDRLKVGHLTQQEVIELVKGLILAVKDLQPSLVHRDIKPANIMFRKNQPEPVLVDFGIVRDLSQTSLTASWWPSGPGTPFFSSPEQLTNDKALIDWRSDQFAIGVIASLLLTGRHPYQVDPANPNAAVYAVSERRGPSPDFNAAMAQAGLPAIIKMVQPWPVLRFGDPDTLLAALK
ncbi:MAG TPA: serine/threonine-protein kinase [Candidatus Limnocylindrales bacterium]|nr:serine/threonine-protein kinase [Candidatus Limnocylindrales bacterium]